jgi:hypothetical protein
MDKPRPISSWVKANSLIVMLAGGLTTGFALIVGASNVMPLLLKAFNLPDCFTYASVYRDPYTYFKLEGPLWREYANDGAHIFDFKEVHRTRDNIDLLNLTERPGVTDWQSMIVRLPVCGGTARITGNPEHWIDLYQVWRE